LGSQVLPFWVMLRHHVTIGCPTGGPLGTESLSPAILEIVLRVLRSRVWPVRVTWRHRSRDILIPYRPFLIGGPFEV